VDGRRTDRYEPGPAAFADDAQRTAVQVDRIKRQAEYALSEREIVGV
jgi:hypothetical protein